nr:uncharacterized protein LOC111428766 isoform X14 [Onthophagus taurus]
MMGTMSSIKEIMQFCRLCLVKDQVNVSIFEEHGDTRDVKRKISECLPVTVSEEDSLPKKICDGCLYKLELLYQFRTTCVSAEKQLQVWIAELNNSESKEDQDLKLQHSQTSVKEEIFDATDHPDNSEYVIEEQHISYEEGDIPYNESQDDNDDGDATNSSDDEPLAKRRKRFLEEQVQTDDTLKTADNKMAITKLEHESDDENVDDPEPNFVSVGTSDDQQPGPSGLNKMSATTTNAEMPLKLKHIGNLQGKLVAISDNLKICIECGISFSNMNDLQDHIKNYHWPGTSISQTLTKSTQKTQVQHQNTKQYKVLCHEQNDSCEAILPDDLLRNNLKLVLNNNVIKKVKQKIQVERAIMPLIKVKSPENKPNFIRTDKILKRIDLTRVLDDLKNKSNTKNARCNYCKSMFASTRDLNLHVDTWHICSVCQKGYQNLINHTSMQSICMVCHTAVCEKRLMHSHYLSRHGKHWCSQCNLIFRDASDLYRHCGLKHLVIDK